MNEGISEGLEQFKEVVTVVGKLLKNRQIFVSISAEEYPGIALLVEEEPLEAELARSGLAAETFRSVLKDEISLMVFVCLEDDQEVFVRRHTESLEEDEEGYDADKIAEETALVREKLEIVGEWVVNEDLKNRHLFKRRAKSPTFVALNWDVNVKYFDSEAKTMSPFPYATLQLRFQKGIPESPLAILTGGASQIESVEIDYAFDEIEYVIRTLTVIKDRLMAVKEGK